MEIQGQNFKKHSKTGMIISAFGIAVILLSVFLFIYLDRNKEQEITTTKKELIIKDSLTTELNDSLKSIKKSIKIEEIECIAELRKGEKMPNGSPLYDITFKISDSLLNSKLKSVDYFFNHASYWPKLKNSIDSLNNFKKTYVGYGCIDTVQVFLHYKNSSKTDTIFFPMCNKVKINLPTQ